VVILNFLKISDIVHVYYSFFLSLAGISFLAPHINNLFFLELCQKYGVYKIIQLLFFIKLSISVFMFLMGPNHMVLLCLFIAR